MKEQSFYLECHGDHKQPGTKTFTLELGFGIVVVLDVPTQFVSERNHWLFTVNFATALSFCSANKAHH